MDGQALYKIHLLHLRFFVSNSVLFDLNLKEPAATKVKWSSHHHHFYNFPQLSSHVLATPKADTLYIIKQISRRGFLKPEQLFQFHLATAGDFWQNSDHCTQSDDAICVLHMCSYICFASQTFDIGKVCALIKPIRRCTKLYEPSIVNDAFLQSDLQLCNMHE